MDYELASPGGPQHAAKQFLSGTKNNPEKYVAPGGYE